MVIFKEYGFDDLQRHLKQFDKDFKKDLKSLIRKIGRVARKYARDYAPKSEKNKNLDHKPGEYKKSIKYYVASALKVRIVAVRKTPGKKSDGYLGNILEYGRKENRPKTARPHMVKAIERALKEHEAELNSIMDKVIRELEKYG